MKNPLLRFATAKNIFLLLTLIPTLLVFSAHGNDDLGGPKGSNSCTLDGSWYILPSSGFGPYTLNVTMPSSHEGSGAWVATGFEPTAFGLCPESVDISNAQGAFSKTGPRSFEFTLITFATDASGQVECVGKTIAWIELDRGCKSGHMNGQLELYTGDQNPFGDDKPFIILPETPEDYSVVRMTVDKLNE